MYNYGGNNNMYVLTKLVLFLTVYMVGVLIMFNYPESMKLGMILSFGGLLAFGLSLAYEHIKTLE